MTNTEIIAWLEQIEKDIYVCSLESTLADDMKSCAIHAAIEILKAEPCDRLKLDGMLEEAYEHGYEQARHDYEVQPCDEAINRRAVLDVFGHVMDYWKEHAIDVEPHEIEDALIEQYEFTAKQLSELPFVTPKPLYSVLDKMKAEIEQTADEEQKHDKKWAIGLRYAVKIIDKYKAGSEG